MHDNPSQPTLRVPFVGASLNVGQLQVEYILLPQRFAWRNPGDESHPVTRHTPPALNGLVHELSFFGKSELTPPGYKISPS